MASLLGSVSRAVIVAKAMGLDDPRTQGSGNPGATNILRMGGKKPAILTLIGDVLKGLVPLFIARAITDNPIVLALVGMGAFFGHLYPVFFGFKGGKGVATGIGVVIGLSATTAGLLVITWLVVALLSRYSSLSALVASALSPVYALWLGLPGAYVIAFANIAIIMFIRHRANISRLLAGKESKIKLTRG